MGSLSTSHTGSTLDFSTVYSTTSQCKILRQDSNAKDNYGKDYSGQRGEIKLSKCLYYILFYIFDPDGTPHMESVTNMGDDLVSLTSGKEPILSNLEHRDYSNAHWTLGMWPAPNGSAKKQYEESLAKSKRFSQGVLEAPMSRFEAITAYWTMYIPSIMFGIGSTLMDLDQLEEIQKPLMNAILPKMGYSSKTCRHVVFGPRNYFDIGARDLVTERGVKQTLIFVKHIRSDKDRSKLLQIGFKWFQVHASIARPILECPSIDLPYLEVGWFRTLRKFLCFINAEIHIDNRLRVPQTLRDNDHALMESFLETQNFTSTDLYRLNLQSRTSSSYTMIQVMNH